MPEAGRPSYPDLAPSGNRELPSPICPASCRAPPALRAAAPRLPRSRCRAPPAPALLALSAALLALPRRCSRSRSCCCSASRRSAPERGEAAGHHSPATTTSGAASFADTGGQLRRYSDALRWPQGAASRECLTERLGSSSTTQSRVEEPSSVRRGRHGVLCCHGHLVDIPPVQEEARGGQAEADTDGRYITYPRQQELGPYLAGRGTKDRRATKHICIFQKTKQRKKPHPVTGSMWVSDQAEAQCDAYVSKFKEKHGETSQPAFEDFDVEVEVLAGQGRKGGRLWVGDGFLDPSTIPHLRDIRRGRTSEQPQVESRPRASDLAIERLRAEMEERDRKSQEERMQMQQQLTASMEMQRQLMEQINQLRAERTYAPAPPPAPNTCPPYFNWMPAPDPSILALLQSSSSPVTPQMNINNTGIIRNLSQFSGEGPSNANENEDG